MNKQLEVKVERSLKLLRTASRGEVVEVSYSGGKDSDVILELCKMSGVKFRAIYKNTTIDPPGTIAHCVSKGAEIQRPPITFFRLIRKKGMPTRRCRFCCEKMKEYKVMDIAVQGIRRSESNRRAARYSSDDPVICRLYGRSRAQHVNIILPILDWTDDDVKEFLTERNVRCHPYYYDENGEFIKERRLGCLTCPLQGDQGLEDFEANPRLVRVTLIYLQAWWDEHPNTKSHDKFQDVFELFVHNVFFRSYDKFVKDKYKYQVGGSTRSWLEHHFGINLIDLPKLRKAPAASGIGGARSGPKDGTPAKPARTPKKTKQKK